MELLSQLDPEDMSVSCSSGDLYKYAPFPFCPFLTHYTTVLAGLFRYLYGGVRYCSLMWLVIVLYITLRLIYKTNIFNKQSMSHSCTTIDFELKGNLLMYKEITYKSFMKQIPFQIDMN